jgi:ABC-type transporter Mla MlaB component
MFLDDGGPYFKDVDLQNNLTVKPDSTIIKRRIISKNIDHLEATLEKKQVNIILDFSHVSHCDSASCLTLQKIVHNFQKQQVRIIFSGVRPALKLLLGNGGVIDELGECNVSVTVEEAVEKLEFDIDNNCKSVVTKKHTMNFHEVEEFKKLYEKSSE